MRLVGEADLARSSRRGRVTLLLVFATWWAGSIVTPRGHGEPLLPALGDDEARLRAEEAKLKLLSDKVAELKQDLEAMGERQSSLLGELQRLDAQIQIAHQELALLRLRLGHGYRAIDEHLKQVQVLEASIDELEPYLKDRAVSLYKLGQLSYLRLLFSVQEPRELTRAYRYVSRLARADSEKMGRLRADQEALETRKADLLAATREMLETRRGIERTSEELQTRRAVKASMLDEVSRRREMAGTLLDELDQSREELGRLIERMVAGESPESPSVHLPIRLFRGELDWPVTGSVAVRFGKQRHPRFLTVTLTNGMVIEAPPGSEARAVYDGTVVFASWFKGYGRLVIVSHPHDVHSLYGHLAELSVAEGASVARGAQVGRVGDTGPQQGTCLYFEMREDGKPVDPGEWLKSGR